MDPGTDGNPLFYHSSRWYFGWSSDSFEIGYQLLLISLGYVPVVNRGQRDIDSRKKITIALEAERNFFENHPAYKSKAQYCGTPFLARKLSMVI